MTPIFFLNPSSSNNYSSHPSDHYEDHLNTHQFLTLNSQPSSSSKSLTTHMFLNSNDQNEIFNKELHPPPYQHEGDNFRSQAYIDHGSEKDNQKQVLESSTWNKNGINNMKWMSSKMRVMLKMKKHDPINLNNNYSSSSRQVTKLEEHKLHSSTMEETDNSSNSTSSNNSVPIRVCSDCNTSKTPLWRSGPRGPKSLCNACGIRQRKARRALAAAAAANGDSNGAMTSVIAPLKVIKSQHKNHKKPSKLGHVTKYKKRPNPKQIMSTTPSPPASPSLSLSPSPSQTPSSSTSPSSPSSSPVRKNCVEEFLENLSKNLKFYHVLPQDEKEAAILLMALSCGYAHEP